MNKRIVSKSAYAQAQAKRAGLQVLGTLFIFIMIVCGCVTAAMGIVCAITGIAAVVTWSLGMGIVSLISLVVTLFCVALTYGFWRAMETAAVEADNIHLGIPLTRANSIYLPAQDTLVRASAEPLQAQESTLLRAAEEGRDKREEQLVRAVGGQK